MFVKKKNIYPKTIFKKKFYITTERHVKAGIMPFFLDIWNVKKK